MFHLEAFEYLIGSAVNAWLLLAYIDLDGEGDPMFTTFCVTKILYEALRFVIGKYSDPK